MKYVYQGPPYNTYRKGTKIKIDPQKYVYQGSPYNSYKIKTKNRTRQNRPSEIGLSGVPHIIRIKSG